MATFTQRGFFVAIGGIFLLAIGLSGAGIRTFGDLAQQIWNILNAGQSYEEMDKNGQRIYDAIDFLVTLMAIPETIIEYCMFLGLAMTLAAVIGLPTFRMSANASVIRISREVDREKAFAGEYVHVTVNVTNTSRRRLDFVEIYDGIPETFEIALGENFIVTQLGGRETKKFSYIVRVPTRGVWKIGPSKVNIHDRIGFYFEEDTREFYTELLVYPSYEDVRRMNALSKRRQQGMMFGAHKTKQKGMGDDFHSLRRYYPGDEFRKVDWKAFARSGELMVREVESEKNIRVVVFLDHSGSMGGGIPNNTKLDFAIRAVMLLMHMCEERRDLFGLCTYADRPTSYMAPQGGRQYFFQLLETLALVDPRGRSDPLAAAEYVMNRLPRSSFFIFLTDLESGRTEDFVEAAKEIRARKNHMTVISPYGPFFESRVELSPVERALAEAVTEEFFEERKLIEEGLQGLEVEVLNVGPDDMLPQVISQYLKAKATGKALI
jgi:uncharacterized protein (DUF58 family)